MPTRADRGQAPAAKRLPLFYTATWAGMGMISLAYVAQVALSGPGATTSEARAVSDTAVEAAEARAIKLKVTLEEFQRDLANLRSAPDGEALATNVEARLAALEERLSIETGIAVARREAASAASTDATRNAAAEIAGAVTSGVETRANSAWADGAAAMRNTSRNGGPRVAGAIATSVDGQTRLQVPIETGSVDTASAPRLPPVQVSGSQVAGGQAAVAQGQTAQGQTAQGQTAQAPAIANRAPPGRTPSVAHQVIAAVAPPAPGVPPPPASPTAQIATPVTSPPASELPPGFAPVVTPVAKAPPPLAAPAPKPYAVQLASAAQPDILRDSWAQLELQHADALRNLQPRVSKSQTTAEAGPIYDLVAGPFRSVADAKKACKALAARGLDCKIANFTGDAL